LTETRKKSKKKIKYLVDYDLPVGLPGKKQFYRDLKKLNVTKSSESVILTSDLKTATKVHKKATAMGGKANFYKVKKKRKA
jgi:hypothetical protein